MTRIYIDEFQASDDDGNIYTVERYREIISVPQVGGPTQTIKGGLYYQTDTGSEAKLIQNNPVTLHVLGTNKVIRQTG